jgi:hypothetical protein
VKPGRQALADQLDEVLSGICGEDLIKAGEDEVPTGALIVERLTESPAGRDALRKAQQELAGEALADALRSVANLFDRGQS